MGYNNLKDQDGYLIQLGNPHNPQILTMLIRVDFCFIFILCSFFKLGQLSFWSTIFYTFSKLVQNVSKNCGVKISNQIRSLVIIQGVWC